MTTSDDQWNSKLREFKGILADSLYEAEEIYGHNADAVTELNNVIETFEEIFYDN